MADVLEKLRVRKKLLHPDGMGGVVVGHVRPYCWDHVILDRIEVRERDECWRWTGNKTVAGYGKISLKGEHLVYAHRMVFSILIGSIPEGLEIRHKCDNPICCNPFHLLPGTHHDNMMDKMRRGRANIPSGDRQGQRKLSSHQIPEIRLLHRNGIRKAEIARRFNVAHSTIRAVIDGMTWKTVL